ncbi:MAG: hypothetical protein HW405_338 [Candidatus Berkelbacteria bacterium]|nr:hypothetical protein [Candidatus Berkelbacteria bacterium]
MDITAAPWKTKTDKTVMDFLIFWSKSAGQDAQNQSQKARDLLTISAQARLVTYKDANQNPIQDLPIQLDKFIGISDKTDKYEIISTKLINENNVQTKVRFSSIHNIDKIFTLILENNIWLIDSITDYSLISPSPTLSDTPQVSPSSS